MDKAGKSGGIIRRNWVRIPLVFFCGLLGLGGIALYYSEGTSYFFDDPKMCAKCHVMRDQYDGWQKAGHHGAARCNDCHIPQDSAVAKYSAKVENGFRHSGMFGLSEGSKKLYLQPSHVEVLNRNCRRCHAKEAGTIPAHGGKEAKDLSCVQCHVDAGHCSAGKRKIHF